MRYKLTSKELLFCAAICLQSLSANFAHPVTPTIFQSLGLSDYMFGVALGSMLVVNFILSPFWGKLCSYVSSRKAILIGSIGYATGQLFFALAQTEMQFVLARVFAGLFTSGVMVGMLNYTVNTNSDEKRRGFMLTTLVTIQAVMGAFGYFVGGFLGEIDMLLPVYIQVVALASAGFMFYAVCKDDRKPDVGRLNMKVIAKEVNPFAAFVSAGKFMTVTLLMLFLVCSLHGLASVAFDQSFNYYIKDQFNFPSSYNGALKAVMGLITLAANSTITLWIINNTNVRRSSVFVFGICTVTMIGIVLFGQNMVPFVILNVLVYALSSAALPVIQNIVSTSVKEGMDSNLVMGFYSAMRSLGSIVGSFASGALYAAGAILPFVMCIAAFAGATLLSTVYYGRYKRENKSA